MKHSLHILQRLRKIREDRAGSKLRAAQAQLRDERAALASLHADTQRAMTIPLVTGAHAQEVARHLTHLHTQIQVQTRRVTQAEADLRTRRSLLQLRSRELSSLERIQEEIAAREAEAARKKEAKELAELAARIYRKEAA